MGALRGHGEAEQRDAFGSEPAAHETSGNHPQQESEQSEHPILQLTDEDYANLPSAADPLADKSEAEIEELYPELATEATILLGSDGADGVMQTEPPKLVAAE